MAKIWRVSAQMRSPDICCKPPALSRIACGTNARAMGSGRGTIAFLFYERFKLGQAHLQLVFLKVFMVAHAAVKPEEPQNAQKIFLDAEIGVAHKRHAVAE